MRQTNQSQRLLYYSGPSFAQATSGDVGDLWREKMSGWEKCEGEMSNVWGGKSPGGKCQKSEVGKVRVGNF